jgi:hypothetical protein
MANTAAEEKILLKVTEFRKDGVAGSSELFDRMRQGEDFGLLNKQWDPLVKSANESRKKFCLTIPLIKPQINQVAGGEVQNPKDIKVKNTRTGTAAVAWILTSLAKQVTDTNRVRFESSQMFKQGLGTGQGALGVFIDKTNDPLHANLSIRKLNEHNVMFDPNCIVYDINDQEAGCKYVIWEPWVDKDLLKKKYPKKKPDLDSIGNSGIVAGICFGAAQSFINWIVPGRKGMGTSVNFSSQSREDVSALQKTQFRVNHTWWREPKTCVHWYDKTTSEIDSLLLMKDVEIKAARDATEADPNRFLIEEVVCNVMHHTIRVDNIFLEDRIDELNGVMMYPIIPFWPYFVNGYKSGMSEDLIGVQNEINWLHSMKLNLIKLLANSGWVMKADPTGEMAKWLKKHGGKDGIAIDASKAGGGLDKIEPPTFPVALAASEGDSKETLKAISGVRLEDPTTSKDRVASAIALKQQSAAQGQATIFLNKDYTDTMFGDLIIDIIRKNDIFSEDEIREIVDADDLIDAEFMDKARNIVIQELQAAGEQIPQPPNPQEISALVLETSANEIAFARKQGLETEIPTPEEQQMLVEAAILEDQALFQQFMAQVNQHAQPLAEGMLMDSIRNMKAGKYSTNVVTSPMATSIRAVKASEMIELSKVLNEVGDVGLDGEDIIRGFDVDNVDGLIAGRAKKLQGLQQNVDNLSVSV